MKPISLYSFFRSSAAWRVRIALELKGLEYETIPINLRAGEHRETAFLARNPGGLVPAIELEGSVLTQSLAIIEYLDERFPEPRLLPDDPLARARVRAFALQIACEIHPLNNLRTLKFLTSNLGLEESQVHGEWYKHWIIEGFRALEAMAQGKNYCFGDRVSLADIALVPQIGNAKRFHVELSNFPKLLAIANHLEPQAAFLAAAPEMQPDRVLYEPG